MKNNISLEQRQIQSLSKMDCISTSESETCSEGCLNKCETKTQSLA